MEILKFWVDIAKKIVEAIFNNGTEVNILLYFIILALELAVRLSITIIMRDINDKPSHIISYIPEVSVWIEDVTIYQSFFVLECGINQYILGQFFKIVIWMAW